MILLSTPFTYKADEKKLDLRIKEAVEHARAEATVKMANHLMNLGHYVFSPIVYGLALIQGGLKLPPTWEFWQGFCEAGVRACTEVWVVDMEGWDRSAGVAGEIDEAKRQGKPVRLIAFDLEKPVVFLPQAYLHKPGGQS